MRGGELVGSQGDLDIQSTARRTVEAIGNARPSGLSIAIHTLDLGRTAR